MGCLGHCALSWQYTTGLEAQSSIGLQLDFEDPQSNYISDKTGNKFRDSQDPLAFKILLGHLTESGMLFPYSSSFIMMDSTQE